MYLHFMKQVLLLILLFVGALISKAQYSVGDLYDENGVKGIVVKVDDSGQHGLIMSLNRCKGKWCIDKKAKFVTDAFYEDDGEKNMAMIDRYITENRLSWSDFPFFEWCRSLGDGWYAPALDELKCIAIAINGSYTRYNETKFRSFDKLIKNLGGESVLYNVPMSRIKIPYILLSSTETNNGEIFICAVDMPSPYSNTLNFRIHEFVKKSKLKFYLGSRAVHKF